MRRAIQQEIDRHIQALSQLHKQVDRCAAFSKLDLAEVVGADPELRSQLVLRQAVALSQSSDSISKIYLIKLHFILRDLRIVD